MFLRIVCVVDYAPYVAAALRSRLFGCATSALFLFVGSSATIAQTVERNSDFSGTFSYLANFESRFSSWQGTRGTNVFSPEPGKGYQVYSPFLIGLDYEQASAVKIETRAKGGVVFAKHLTRNQEGSYNGPVDTQVSFDATFLNLETIRPKVGVVANLPTGESNLPGNKRFTRMDPDLVEVGSYGEGYNINPTAGFTVGLNQSTALSLAAGYAWRGVFYKEGVDLAAGIFDLKRKINPGNVFTANANLATSIGAFSFLSSIAYMSETNVDIDGVPFARKGARYITNLAASYKFDDRWALNVNGTWSYQDKNKVSDNMGGLRDELKNSNSNIFIGSIEPTYMATERLKLGVNYSILYRKNNFYDIVDEQFIPAKIKHSVGISMNYAAGPNTLIELRGSHFWVGENVGPLLVTFVDLGPVPPPPPIKENLPPSLSYTGWTGAIVASFRY